MQYKKFFLDAQSILRNNPVATLYSQSDAIIEICEDKKMDNKAVLTVQEAAKIMRISPSTLYVLLRDNKVPHIALGKRIIIPAEPFYLWLNTSVVGG